MPISCRRTSRTLPAWCDAVRKAAGRLFPSKVRLVSSQPELRDNLPAAQCPVVESFAVGRDELACAAHLKVVHKYGAGLRNIDVAACRAAGVDGSRHTPAREYLVCRACLRPDARPGRRIDRVNGLISIGQLEAAGLPYRPFDRRHVPGQTLAGSPECALSTAAP